MLIRKVNQRTHHHHHPQQQQQQQQYILETFTHFFIIASRLYVPIRVSITNLGLFFNVRTNRSTDYILFVLNKNDSNIIHL